MFDITELDCNCFASTENMAAKSHSSLHFVVYAYSLNVVIEG